MDQGVATLIGASIVRSADSSPMPDREVVCAADHAPADLLMHRPDSTCIEHVDDSVMQISGTGHWFLEGWIGDHSVDFLFDSGSSVTAMSNSLYQTLVRAGPHWECWNILRERYAAQTGLHLACRAALTAWCHSWVFRRSFPSLSVT